MELTSKSEYAIHGLYYLTCKVPNEVTYVSEIAGDQNVSESYLAKVFQMLAREGLLVSFRGTSGGYALARPPEEITLMDVVEAVEGKTRIFSCSATKTSCSLGLECFITGIFERAEREMFSVLEEITLRKIVDEMQGFPIKLGLENILTKDNREVPGETFGRG